MPGKEFQGTVFVLHGRFCRFGSYSTIQLVDNPLGATVYVNKRAADTRAAQTHYLNHEVILPSELRRLTITTEICD